MWWHRGTGGGAKWLWGNIKVGGRRGGIEGNGVGRGKGRH